jgi:hypothetical protein
MSSLVHLADCRSLGKSPLFFKEVMYLFISNLVEAGLHAQGAALHQRLIHTHTNTHSFFNSQKLACMLREPL